MPVQIKALIPSLELLDGVRFRGRKLHRMLYMKEKKQKEAAPEEVC